MIRDNFGELFTRIYPDVEKIIWKYDGMLLTQQLLDSINCDLYNYKQSFKHRYCIEEQQLDRVIKSCYQEAVRRLEIENSKYDEDFENSFVCHSISQMVD